MTQLAMTWSPPPPKQRPSITERFEAFHRANPHVLEELRRLALARLDAGATYISSKALYEECRVSLRTLHGDDYKLNNDYTPYYADLLRVDPRLASVIQTRQRRAK